MKRQLVIKNRDNFDNSAIKLIVLCVALYAISYLGRKSYDSSINDIIGYYGVGKADAGIVGTGFFITYAIGQVFHGLMCRYYNPRLMVFISLIVCGTCNFAMGIMPASGFVYLKYIWIINGFFSAALWSLLILLLNRVLAKKHLKQALFAMCFPVSIGIFIVYVVSALCTSLGAFKSTFYFSSIVIIGIALVWIVFCGGLVKKCAVEKQEIDGEESVYINDKKAKNKQKTKIDKSFIVLFAILAFFAIVDNFVKDGLTTWTPTILKEKYSLDNSISLVLTVMLPMFALMGAMLAIKLNKRFKNYVSLCGICFFIATIIISLLILCLGLNTWVITLVCFMFVSAVMAGVNNVLTSIFPLQCKNVNAGLVAGLIDGFCYVGSALSSYGLGAIAQNVGNWDVIMYLFAGLSALCVVMVVIYNVFIRLKKTKANKID